VNIQSALRIKVNDRHQKRKARKKEKEMRREQEGRKCHLEGGSLHTEILKGIS
jgi:Na+/phosphate symporter